MSGRPSNAPIAKPARNWRRSGSRWALVVGFGALLVLMAFTGVDSLRSLRAFEATNNQIRQEFLDRENTLDKVRAGLYESANVMTDYFLTASDPRAQEVFRSELQSIETETAAALQSCVHSLPAGKKEPFQHLAMEMEGYWSTIGSALSPEAKDKERSDTAALRSAVIRRHANVLSITKDLSALNDDDRKESERRIEEVSGQFRRRLVMIVS